MKIDHIAIVVDDPQSAAAWYMQEFGGEMLYDDPTWCLVGFENIKLAFVVSSQHPAHFAFEVDGFEKSDRVKKHRDGSESVYKKDPWGNVYELVKYEK